MAIRLPSQSVTFYLVAFNSNRGGENRQLDFIDVLVGR